jgi:hypothetical protein
MTRSEAILEARRKYDAGDFNRRVSQRMPENFTWDSVTLDCGHIIHHSEMILGGKPLSERRACWRCAEAWIAENATASC